MPDHYSKFIENLRASRTSIVRAIEMLETGQLRSGDKIVNTTTSESLELMRRSLAETDRLISHYSLARLFTAV